MLFGKTKVQKALAEALRDGDFGRDTVRDLSIDSPKDARALADTLRAARTFDPSQCAKALDALCPLMQTVSDEATAEAVYKEAMPQLEAICRTLMDKSRGEDESLSFLSPELWTVKIMAMYGYDAAAPIAAELIRRRHQPDMYGWTIALGAIQDESPAAQEICDALDGDLPDGFCLVSLLDMANKHAIAGSLERHPFDSDAGYARLESWLRDRDEANFSYAHSATAALPFIDAEARQRLFGLAMDHPDTGVQMEAAWASAKLGSDAGAAMLARFCENVHTAATAVQYLDELGRFDAAPPCVHEPDFVALAQMSQWLQHPNEFGRVPDNLELLDTRELH